MNGDYISTLIELKPKYKNVSAQEMQLTQSCSSILGIHQINALTPLVSPSFTAVYQIGKWNIQILCYFFFQKKPFFSYHALPKFLSNLISDDLRPLVCDQSSLLALANKFGHF